MLNLAGKYAGEVGKYARNQVNKISRKPLDSALAGAALAGGLATAGNVLFGEAEREGPGRLAAEAIGAGALGGLAGYGIAAGRPFLRGMKRVIGHSLRDAGGGQRATGVGMEVGISPDREELRQKARDAMTTLNRGYAAGSVVNLLGAGALGGMIGGGVSNVGQMVGIPGLNSDTITDPELVGSSNTQMARMSTPTLRYIG